MNVKTEFAFGVLSGKIDFALWGLDALSRDDKVVDQFLHAHEDALFVGKDGFGVHEVDVAFWHGVEDLLDDADRLSHFFHADEITIITIAIFTDGNIELILLIAEIWVVTAKVTIDSRSTKVWPSHAVADGVIGINRPDVAHALKVNFVLIEKGRDFLNRGRTLDEELPNFILKPLWDITNLTTHTSIGSGEARAGELLTEIVNFFPLGEGVEKNGHRAHVHGANTDTEKVGRKTGKLTAQHAKCLTAWGKFPAHQLFHSTSVSHIVRERGEVVQSIGVRHELVVVHVLGDLFITTMQVADVGFSFFNDFTIELKHEAENPVGRGVGRAHIEHHFFAQDIIGLGTVIINSFGRGCSRIRSLVSGRFAHCAW